MLNLSQVRRDTPACEQVIHLNNAGASLPPQAVTQAMLNYLMEEAEIGGYETAARYTDRMEMFYISVARLLQAEPGNIAFFANATDAFAKALSAIPFQRGDVILTSQDDYVSNQLAFLQLVKRLGVQLIRVPNSEAGPIDLTAMEALIKKYQPKLVAVTHVPTNSGLIQPVEAIGKLCKAYDCWYVVDACQSAGQISLDVSKMHCDFLCASYRKFMRGPRGAGFMYVSDKALEAGLSPIGIDLRGAIWKAPEEYSLLANAKRFEYWERSYALVIGSVVATEYLLGLGMEEVAAQLKQIGNYTRKALGTVAKIRLLDRGKHQANIITFVIPGQTKPAIYQTMKTHGINFSFTTKDVALLDFEEKQVDWAIRISPHYFNTEKEIEVLLEALDALL